MKRINSIDITRGIVMMIMALDHTRDLLHRNSLIQQPTDLVTTTPILFITRFITHLCAPTFVFLAGVSAYLLCQKFNNSGIARKFFLIRGMVLIIIEFTLVNVGMFFDLQFRTLLFEVIAAIGVGYMILAVLLTWKSWLLASLAILIILLHNLLPALFAPAVIPLGQQRLFVLVYHPVPWLGILLLGFSLGKIFVLPAMVRRKYFLRAGFLLVTFFVVLRLINLYGEIPWSVQKTSELTLLSFINVTKYPPSLQFIAFMLGGMSLLLYASEALNNQFTAIAVVYGKVPLFYFITHWYLLHGVLFMMVFLQGYTFKDLIFGFNFGRPAGSSGVSLGVVYVIWICVVITMYPLCKWYARYKETNKDKKWLRYL